MKLKLLSCALLLITCRCMLSGQEASVLSINEIMAVNESILADEDGDCSDWIEIYNSSAYGLYLKGWGLTDDKRNPGKWKFPDVSIGAGAYLLVFASGKNRTFTGKNLHTNFKLTGSGEYLALTGPDGKIVSGFIPEFPEQRPDISYGYLSGPEPDYLSPSPGTKNQYIWSPEIPEPQFTHKHGFYENAFTLQITSPDPSADVYYTSDGSFPGSDNGVKYTVPLQVGSTSILRAVAVKPYLKPSETSTATYIFTEDVIRQSSEPEGYPLLWGPYTAISGSAKADYEMDPEMVSDPLIAEAVKKALISLPVISLVTDRNYLFSHDNDPENGGIYIYTGPPLTDTVNGVGSGWERPVSFEYFDVLDSVSLQVDCGLELHGGHSRRPEKSPKHSFRLVFKSKFGPPELIYPLFGDKAVSEFEAIVLRAGFNNTWIHHSNSERLAAQYISDSWAKETHRAMGHNASHGIFVHLFINGLYWGIYNPSEKLDKDYAASYFGGDDDDYDVMKDYAEVADGSKAAWTTLIAMANGGISENTAYQRIQGKNADGVADPSIEAMVDVVNLADYMILNFYAGNTDWDHHNWVAVRNRINPGKGFTFFCWDEEKILESLNTNIIKENNNYRPSRVFQQLMKNAEFKRLFADRVQRFCFGDGALTPASAIDRWKKLAGRVGDAIIAESVRWGDYRRDVHRWQTAGPFDLYTPDNNWIPRMNFMLGTYFPERTEIFLSQLKNAGLFPALNAPVYMINGEPVKGKLIETDDLLSMTCDSGVIYFTTDGSDPAVWSPVTGVRASATKYNGALALTGSCRIKSRTLFGDIWSAVNDRFFLIPDDFNDIKITEIHYNPIYEGVAESKDLEFIELKNTGLSTLDLEGFQFVKGIRFRFPSDTQFNAGAFIVLASDAKSFYDRYGFMPFGEYIGQLENDGEHVAFISAWSDTLFSVSYLDHSGWPSEPDGIGNSLVSSEINPDNLQDRPEFWRASYYYGGSPGADDVFNPDNLQNKTEKELVTMFQPYPNPMSDYAYVSYQLNKDASTDLSVFDISGQKVYTIENGFKSAGNYVTGWKGNDGKGNNLPEGIYLVSLTIRAEGKVNIVTRKLVLMR